MAYKKYIERGGKIYGPYIYHSKRIDGKVVSQYHGTKEKKFGLDSKNLKFLIVALGIFFLMGLSYVVYNGEWEITGDVVSNIELEEIPVTNEIVEPDLNTNVPVKIVSEEIFESELTAEERNVLESEIEDLSLEIKKAVVKNGFLTVRYELGSYWIEFNYEEDIDEDTLNKFMEADRIKWLKDLSKRVSGDSGEPVESLNGQSFGF
jgi:hypothetical protein